MSTNKLYSSKEIKEILERATELQKKQKINSEEGLTLDELEQIASDSGIDLAFIQQAITEQHNTPSGKSGFFFLGAPLSLEVGREISETMSADNWGSIVQEARRTFRKSGGTVQKLGNSLEWMSPDLKFISANLTATSSKTGTRFFASTHFGKIAFLAYYFGFVILLLALGIGIGQSDLPLLTSLGISLTGVVTVFGAIRYAFGKWTKRYKNKLENMFNRFEEILRSDQAPSNKEKLNKKESGSPLISIPEEEVEDEMDLQIKNRKTVK